MKLRKKIALFIGIIALLGLGVTYLFLHLILLNRFDRMDEADLRRAMDDTLSSYQNELNMMKTSLLNYSFRDDPYILSNYDISTYQINRFHMIALLNSKGEVVFGGSYHPGDEAVSPLSAEMHSLISLVNLNLPAFAGWDDSKSGIITLDEGPMLVTLLPIINNNKSGPILGTAIAGRMLNEEEIQLIGSHSPLGIRIETASSERLEPSGGKDTWMSAKTGDILTIHTVINDLFGNPSIVISLDHPRQIYKSGLKSVVSFRRTYFITTLLMCIASLIFVNRFILKRMASLIRNIRTIGSSHDLSFRIKNIGRDEFSDVEHEFNRMISSLQSAQERLKLQATLDPLTQLPNRSFFFAKLNEAIEKARKNNLQIALLFIDIDNFKTVNDSWGHDYGDAILKEIAKRITSAMGDNDLVSRLGGDEFTILLADIGEKGDITAHLSRIQEALSAPHMIHDHLLYITASIGVSVYPQNGKDADFLVKQADLAMFHVKQTGRNNFFQYSDTLEESVRRKKVLGQQLLSAIANQELEIHYQPILSAGTLEVIKVEALLRWNSPTYGSVSPAEFIPLAESNGSIVNIGRWVFKQVCADLCSFHKQGLPLKAAVNISAMQLMQPRLLDELLEALEESGLTPYSLELEITESILMSGDSFFTTLQQLREHGFRISLDDFGTGFSSLSYLRRFPVDVIKIDRSFISEITPGQSDDTLVKAIIELSHNLGLLVVSEGIELMTQFDMLRSLGSDELQGYFISKPLKISGIISFLSQKTPIYVKTR
ncbi:EAL domain-containing protein [Paenibacillus sp. BR2-3]|uniref:EAL domain-containing protein n=1 Tax=Paenibacillus sp. BR2-3 TaxID=3048494 RepID=UPI00397771AE